MNELFPIEHAKFLTLYQLIKTRTTYLIRKQMQSDLVHAGQKKFLIMGKKIIYVG